MQLGYHHYMPLVYKLSPLYEREHAPRLVRIYTLHPHPGLYEVSKGQNGYPRKGTKTGQPTSASSELSISASTVSSQFTDRERGCLLGCFWKWT